MNTIPEEKTKRSVTPFVIAVLVILALVVGWHFFFPVLGLAVIALTAGAWGAVVTTIAVLCVAIILFFILTGVGLFIVGLIGVVCAIIAIALFPILFPLITPLLVILLFVAFLRRRKSRRVP